MAAWHLNELEQALSRRGWRIVAKLAGDDYRISATWQIERGGDPRVMLIDFDGLDDLRTLPIERSYACRQRGTQDTLYFHRQRATATWTSELTRFVTALEEAPQ